jgi:hypothetical protein
VTVTWRIAIATWISVYIFTLFVGPIFGAKWNRSFFLLEAPLFALAAPLFFYLVYVGLVLLWGWAIP